MKRSFALVLAILTISTGSNAQEQPAIWTGMYLGGGFGLGSLGTESEDKRAYKSVFNSRNDGTRTTFGPAPRTDLLTTFRTQTYEQNTESSGNGDFKVRDLTSVFFGGNVQLGRFVVGGQIEGGSGLSGTYSGNGTTTTNQHVRALQSINDGPLFVLQDETQSSRFPFTFEATYEITWQASALLRVGYLLTDNLLAYGIGGAARAGFEGAPFTTRNGWVVGGGLEHHIANGWFARGEYRYTDFGAWSESERSTQNSAGANFTEEITISTSTHFHPVIQSLSLGIAKRF